MSLTEPCSARSLTCLREPETGTDTLRKLDSLIVEQARQIHTIDEAINEIEGVDTLLLAQDYNTLSLQQLRTTALSVGWTTCNGQRISEASKPELVTLLTV